MLREIYPRVSLLFLLLMVVHSIHAQNTFTTLAAQSPDGKTVKLAWYLSHWNNTITGFDIKRKQGNGDWVKLNNQPVSLEISLQKNLANVESDASEARRLHDKLATLITANKLGESTQAAFLLRLNNDTSLVKDIAMITSIDYDIALLSGFGYVDHALPGNGSYEYGVFIQGTNELLASTHYNYGNKENADIITGIRAKKIARSHKLQLIWKTDKDKAIAENVIGYYIYKNDVKVSDKPWLAAADGTQEYVWTDTTVTDDTRYAISAVTELGIEGSIKTYNFRSTDFPAEYKSADLENIIWQDNDMKTILKVTWLFPKDFEKFIKGFYVEKDRMPEGYKQVSELLSPSARIFVPSTREFVDTTPITIKSYVRFRVVVLYNDETEITGTEKRFYYFPFLQPPRPQNLKAACSHKEDKMIVDLNWDPPARDDTLTDYYQVYASDPITDKLYLEMGISPPIKINKYKYEIQYNRATRYQFCTQAVGINRVESNLSDTANIIAPSLALPAPDIKSAQQDSDRVTVKWDYPEILDLKGFRIFQNKNLVAGEFEISKDKRQFKTPPLKWSNNYAFSVQAVSESGVTSEISIPAYITIIPKTKE